MGRAFVVEGGCPAVGGIIPAISRALGAIGAGEVVAAVPETLGKATPSGEEPGVTRTTRKPKPTAGKPMSPAVYLGAGIAALLLFGQKAAPQPPPSPTAPAGGPTPSQLPGQPPIAAPGTPVSLTQTGSTTDSVTLTWSPVDGAVSYGVYDYSTQVQLAKTSTNTAEIGGLQANTHYTVYVVAFGATGLASNPSPSTLVITSTTAQAPSVPSIPSAMTIMQTSPTSVSFDWPPVAGADYYQMTNLTTGQVSGPITGTSATISGLSPGVTYQFSLQACSNQVGCSNASSIITVQTSPGAPPAQAPAGFGYANVQPTSVDLHWTTVDGATSYTIVNADTMATVAAGITGTTYTLTGLTAGTTVRVAIEAVNEYGASQPSAALSIALPAAVAPPLPNLLLLPPQAPAMPRILSNTANSPDTGQVGIAWGAVPGATRYEVHHVTGELLATTGGTNASLGVHPGYLLTVYVLACNSAGCSQPSPSLAIVGAPYAGAPVQAGPVGVPGVPGVPFMVGSTPSSPAQASLTIGWSPVPGADHYQVVNPDAGNLVEATVPGTQATTFGAPNAPVRLAVRACNSAGCSVAGPAGSFRTAAYQAALPIATTAATPTRGSSYTVRAGDTLSGIAQRAYGDQSQWQKIYNANHQVIGANPNVIVPGQVLYIPA